MATQPGFDFGSGSGFVDGLGGIGHRVERGFEFGAFAQGYDEGFDAGYAAGFAAGQTAGYADGYAAGFADGAAVGPGQPEPAEPISAPFEVGDLEFVDIVGDALERMTSQFRSGDE